MRYHLKKVPWIKYVIQMAQKLLPKPVPRQYHIASMSTFFQPEDSALVDFKSCHVIIPGMTKGALSGVL